VVNFGLEGMMLCGAFFAVVGSYASHNALAGVLLGALAGMALGGLHAVACLKLRLNQIISSLAINIFAVGFTGFLLYRIFGSHGTSPTVAKVRAVSFDWLSGVPLLGRALNNPIFELSPFVYFALAMAIALWVFLYRTPTGLRVIAVGEKPAAAAAISSSPTDGSRRPKTH